VATALAIRGLTELAPPVHRTAMNQRVARGRTFLEKLIPEDTQDSAFKLLGLLWSRAGVPTTAAAYRKGVDYLLRTQLPGGPWFVRTRAVPVQRDFETGFPHGRNQFISTAATGWATIALAYALDADGTARGVH
jgi:hypothetical protein